MRTFEYKYHQANVVQLLEKRDFQFRSALSQTFDLRRHTFAGEREFENYHTHFSSPL